MHGAGKLASLVVATAAGSGDGERHAEQRRERWAAFGRDVWVNLLANLLAGSVGCCLCRRPA
jgi:hypothetical protein